MPQALHSFFSSTSTTRASTAAPYAASRKSHFVPSTSFLPSRFARSISISYFVGSKDSWSSSSKSPYCDTTTNCAVTSASRRRLISRFTAVSLAEPRQPCFLAASCWQRSVRGSAPNASKSGWRLSRAGSAVGAGHASRSASVCASLVLRKVSVAEPTFPESSSIGAGGGAASSGSLSLKQSPGWHAPTQTPHLIAPSFARCRTQARQKLWRHGKTTGARFARLQTSHGSSGARPSCASLNSCNAGTALVPDGSRSNAATASASDSSLTMDVAIFSAFSARCRGAAAAARPPVLVPS
mmetsp:Transcript_29920/g.92638  ORF Transcript_29920/g.92638 Transcript_29920/m.92638 type:complete len:297 (+) Transcript_29920:1213-2103(+)